MTFKSKSPTKCLFLQCLWLVEVSRLPDGEPACFKRIISTSRFEGTDHPYFPLLLPWHLFTFPGGTNENLDVSFSWGLGFIWNSLDCSFCMITSAFLVNFQIFHLFPQQWLLCPLVTCLALNLRRCVMIYCDENYKPWLSSDNADLVLTKKIWSTKSSCSLRAISNVSTWSNRESFPTDGKGKTVIIAGKSFVS